MGKECITHFLSVPRPGLLGTQRAPPISKRHLKLGSTENPAHFVQVFLFWKRTAKNIYKNIDRKAYESLTK